MAGRVVRPVKHMKTLAYALAGLLLALTPVAVADPGGPDPPDEPSGGGDCSAFVYWLDPPGYRLDPSCIDPPG